MNMPEKSNEVTGNVVQLKASDKQIAEYLKDYSRSADKHQEEVRAAYKAYDSNGWKPVLLYRGRKRPIGNDWLDRPAHPVEDFVGHNNIGVALGSRSNGLADIDIDHEDLIKAAAVFLPATGAKFGRYYGKSEQSLAHWIYRAPADKSYVLKYCGKTICEIRSTGGQTVFPPSLIWDDGLRDFDLVCWDGGAKVEAPGIGDVTEVSFDYLKQCVNLLAASVFVAERVERGGFHSGMLAWAGMLAKAGYNEEDTLKSTVWIAEQSGQEDIEDRIAGVRDTYRKVVAGEDLAGGADGVVGKGIQGISWFREAIPDEKFNTWLSVLFRIKNTCENDGRPVVRVMASKETELYDNVLGAMIATGKFYNMGGQIVVVNQEEVGGTGGGKPGEATAKVTALVDSVSMGAWLTREIQFVQSVLDKVAMQYTDQAIKAPTSVSGELANPATYRGAMRVLNGVCNVPLITRRGRIVDEAWGYDPELKLFMACRFPVRRMHLDEALRVLQEPFIDFPFVGGLIKKVVDGTGVGEGGSEKFGRYHAAAISAILSAVVRPVLDICPMYVITSSQYSDGKSVMSGLIAACVGMEAGSAVSPLTRGGSDEEQEKQISSVLGRGKRVVVYDNHDGEFRSAALTETLTSAMPEFRILGKSEVRAVANKSMFIVNGVNTVLASDLQTRAVSVHLARRELDTRRVFKHDDVVGWCEEKSAEIVSAAISLIAWAMEQPDIVGGEEGSEGVGGGLCWRPSHRFKNWDYLVRRTIMLACGVDISPPLAEDEDRALDAMEEARNQFLPWVLSKWESGLRASGRKGHFYSKDLAQEVVINSDEEGWVKCLSKRPKHPIEQQIGRCLTAVCDVPFKSDDVLYVLKRGIRDKRTGYWIEAI